MLVFSVFFLELAILFFLSGFFINSIFNIVLKLTKSKFLSVYLIFILFLPGVLVHELSHYIFAKILRVGAGNIRLLPELFEGDLRLGSIDVAETDLLRRTIIGISPLISGTLIIVGLPLFFLISDNSRTVTYPQIFIFLFVVFEIGNTMFSSRKDMQGVGKLIILTVLLFVCLHTIGISVLAFVGPIFLSGKIMNFIKTSSVFLSIPLVLDLILVILVRLIQKIPG